jgi:hypothetical protein
MMVLVVLGLVATGLALAWELRFVALWLLVRAVDAAEGADGAGRREYRDFRCVVTEQGRRRRPRLAGERRRPFRRRRRRGLAAAQRLTVAR